MLALLEPGNAFHPNLMPPAVCVEVRPGEPLVEICESLHALCEAEGAKGSACATGLSYVRLRAYRGMLARMGTPVSAFGDSTGELAGLGDPSYKGLPPTA